MGGPTRQSAARVHGVEMGRSSSARNAGISQIVDDIFEWYHNIRSSHCSRIIYFSKFLSMISIEFIYIYMYRVIIHIIHSWVQAQIACWLSICLPLEGCGGQTVLLVAKVPGQRPFGKAPKWLKKNKANSTQEVKPWEGNQGTAKKENKGFHHM